jgi:PAS domain S-box-containing protein
MSNDPNSGQVVFTNKAHCRDCYRCLRVCPVKAIRMENGQAYVVPERCISCGTCIRECPQGAKQFRNDIERASRIIESSDVVAASIAPSFAAVFSEPEQKRLASALRKLGFSYVGETAVGAYQVAQETARLCNLQPDKSHICTACPAVVRYVELYEPNKLDILTPIVSPMIAHARHIKSKLGKNAKVIFIGPCVAKKSEADRPENKSIVDCVLTFSELLDWFEREEISLSMCEESRFNEEPQGDARFFPLTGGSMRTASLNTDLLAADTVSVTGIGDIREAFADCGSQSTPQVIEPLFCEQGCVNGPAIRVKSSLFRRRHDVIDYAADHPGLCASSSETVYPDLTARFRPNASFEDEVTEEQIREVLEKTGKASPENQLNCGACGYSSCREKAAAVVNGMAELEMCIPYMKRLAEQRTDKIIETSPNGIVILDERLSIIHMNPAFRKFFMCSEAVLGRPISYLMDPDPFEKLSPEKTGMITTVIRHDRYNLRCHEILYTLPEEKQYVGIFVDITGSNVSKEKLDRLRAQTVTQARELLEHQINMAQTIAKFLGESSGQGEALLEKLIEIAGDESGEGKGTSEWLKDTYTSK